MILADHPDGTLLAIDTAECAAYITYENRVAPGMGYLEYDFNGIRVTVVKGAGDIPEKLIAYAYGLVYEIVVEDNSTGVLCVGYWEGM